MALFGLPFYKSLPQAARTAFIGTVVLAATHVLVLPIAGRIMQQPVKEAALIAKAQNYEVNMWQMSYHSFSVYRQGLVHKGQPVSGDIVITKINKLKNVRQYQVLYQKHGIVLARIVEL